MKPIKDFSGLTLIHQFGRNWEGVWGRGEEKQEYSLELTLSLVPIYCWLATLSPEVSQYILVYWLEPQVQILFVQANFARIVQERYNVNLIRFGIDHFTNITARHTVSVSSDVNVFFFFFFVSVGWQAYNSFNIM